MKLTKAEARAFRIAVLAEQAHDLPLPRHIADLLRRIGSRSRGFARCRLTIETAPFHEVLDRLIECPVAGVQIHVHADSRRAIAREPQHLPGAPGVWGTGPST